MQDVSERNRARIRGSSSGVARDDLREKVLRGVGAVSVSKMVDQRQVRAMHNVYKHIPAPEVIPTNE
jgi:hypothetical protein